VFPHEDSVFPEIYCALEISEDQEENERPKKHILKK